ncbi:MAG: hypothetical protein CMO33_03370 [Verrucomicrobia bacterium]|nr:hypothetical protein [Verrucomicrobiota bacterium]
MSITEQTLKALGRSRARMRELQGIQLSPGAHADAFDALGGSKSAVQDSISGKSLLDLLGGPEHGKFLDAFSRADWVTMSGPDQAPIVDAGHCLLETLLPNSFPRDLRHFFVDLSHPDTRAGTAVLDIIQRLQSHGEVIVGFNPSSLKDTLENLGESSDDSVERSLARARSALGVGACILSSEKNYAAAERAEANYLISRYEHGDQSSLNELGTNFGTAYCAAGLLGIEEKHLLPIAVAAVETQLSTKSYPSWVEIERHIRQNPS